MRPKSPTAAWSPVHRGATVSARSPPARQHPTASPLLAWNRLDEEKMLEGDREPIVGCRCRADPSSAPIIGDGIAPLAQSTQLNLAVPALGEEGVIEDAVLGDD